MSVCRPLEDVRELIISEYFSKMAMLVLKEIRSEIVSIEVPLKFKTGKGALAFDFVLSQLLMPQILHDLNEEAKKIRENPSSEDRVQI